MIRNWFEVLHEGQKQGWLSYKNLASCIPEKTSTLEVRDAINIAKSLGIEMVSNVEGLPVAKNIQQMCEHQAMEDRLAVLDSDEEEEENE